MPLQYITAKLKPKYLSVCEEVDVLTWTSSETKLVKPLQNLNTYKDK